MKCAKDTEDQAYHLFRAYEAEKVSKHIGPDPYCCNVSAACAATTAAKNFCQEYHMGETTYWDENFPETHDISGLALDEATAFFSETLAPQFVLHINPGIPTDHEIRSLQKVARRNISTTSRIQDAFRRASRTFSAGDSTGSSSGPQSQRGRPSKMTDEQYCEGRSSVRRRSSASSMERAREHCRNIRTRLHNEFGDDTIYHRLELPPELQENKPSYLNDVAFPDRATSLATEFLKLRSSQHIIESLCHKICPDERHLEFGATAVSS